MNVGSLGDLLTAVLDAVRGSDVSESSDDSPDRSVTIIEPDETTDLGAAAALDGEPVFTARTGRDPGAGT